MTMMLARLACAWVSVLAFQLFGDSLLGLLGAPLPSMLVFAWLLGVILWAAFGVVHEAEEIAHRLGEPYGTLILTLSIVIIEVALISAVMLGAKGAPTLGRDTMFAVLMIVLNGVVGIGLLIGGLRHFSQRYNLKGAGSYLSVIIPLTVIPLILPNFTTSTPDGTLTSAQSIAFSLFTLALYGAFLILQTGRHSAFFQEPESEKGAPHVAAPVHAETSRSTGMHVALLLANILPIVILAKSLATVLDFGIGRLGAPVAPARDQPLPRRGRLDTRSHRAGRADDRADHRPAGGAGTLGHQHGHPGDDAAALDADLHRHAHDDAGRRGPPRGVLRLPGAGIQPVRVDVTLGQLRL